MVRGLFREEEYAQVNFNGKASYPIPRDEYEAKRIQPPFDELPRREEFLAHT